jgi:hypothetical protein
MTALASTVAPSTLAVHSQMKPSLNGAPVGDDVPLAAAELPPAVLEELTEFFLLDEHPVITNAMAVTTLTTTTRLRFRIGLRLNFAPYRTWQTTSAMAR